MKRIAKEREEVIKTSFNRGKMLISSLILDTLKKAMLKRIGFSLNKIKYEGDRKRLIQDRIIGMTRLKEDYIMKILRLKFCKWRYKLLNYDREYQLNLKLIEKSLKTKSMMKYFYIWCNNYHKQTTSINNYLKATKRLIELKEYIISNKVRESLNKWYIQIKDLSIRDNLLRKVLIRKDRNVMRKALVYWINIVKVVEEIRNFKELTEAMTILKFKRAMFDRFKHSIHSLENEKIENTRMQLEFNHKKKLTSRFMKILNKVILTRDRCHKENLKAEAFYSMKLNKTLEEKNKLKTKLEQQVPEYTRLKEEIVMMENSHKDKRKQCILRATVLIFRRLLLCYLKRWQYILSIYKYMLKVLKKILTRKDTNKLRIAFHKLQADCNKKKVQEKSSITNSKASMIEDLMVHNKTLNQDLQSHVVHMNKITLLKLKNVVNSINRKYMRNKLLYWKQINSCMNDIQIGTIKLNKLMKSHKLLVSLRKYMNQAKLLSIGLGEEYKVKSMKEIVNKNLLKTTLFGLLINRVMRKALKSRMKKVLLRKLRRKVRRALYKWRNTKDRIANLALEQHNEHINNIIDDKLNKVEEIELSINKIKDDLIDVVKINRNKTLLTISKRLMITRFTNLRSVFYNWRNHTSQYKQCQNLLCRYLHKFKHNNLRVALDNWRNYDFISHMEDIKNKLKQKLTKYNILTRLSTIKIDEVTIENRQLRDIAIKINDDKQVGYYKIDRGINILYKLQNFYIKYSLDSNFFIAWTEMYKREKVLQGKARIITQMYAGKHIYAKLKSYALKMKSLILTKKHLGKLLKHVKKLYIKVFFKRWRHESNIMSKDEIFNVFDNQEEDLIKYKQTINLLKDRTNLIYEKEIIRRRKLHVFQEFKKLIEMRKLLKKKTRDLQDVVRLMRIDRSFSRWHNDTSYLNSINEKETTAKSFRSKILKVKTINRWRQIHYKEVTLPKVINKISKRQYLNHLGYTLEHLKDFNKTLLQSKDRRGVIGCTKLLLILKKMRYIRLTITFTNIKSQHKNTQLDKELLKRIALKCLQRKLTLGMQRWHQKVEEQHTIDKVESTGNTAKAVLELLRKHNSLGKVISDSHLENSLINLYKAYHEKSPIIKSKKDVLKISKTQLAKSSASKSPENLQDDSLNKLHNKELPVTKYRSSLTKYYPYKSRLEQRDELVRKLLKAWICKARCIDLSGNCIIYWQKWMQVKNDIRKSANFILRRLVNTEKAWVWNKFKNIKRAAAKTYKVIPRTELIKHIVNEEKRIELMNKESVVMENIIKDYQCKNNDMTIAYYKGRVLAAISLGKLLIKPTCKLFKRWKLVTQKLRIKDLNEILAAKFECFEKLNTIKVRLAERNNELSLEYKELHKASMDGVEIANIIQEIAHEREQLSIDLSNRSLTVKKLVEENKGLQRQLDMIKQENDNLIKLIKNTII